MSGSSKLVAYYIRPIMWPHCEQCSCLPTFQNPVWLTEHEFESDSIEVEYIQCSECLEKFFNIIPGEGTPTIRVGTEDNFPFTWEVFMVEESLLNGDWNE